MTSANELAALADRIKDAGLNFGDQSDPLTIKLSVAERDLIVSALRATSTAGAREALRFILIEDDSEEADDECELCAGRGTVDAYTSRTEGKGRLEGRDEIGCPACIERHHSRVVRSAIDSPTNSEWNAAVEDTLRHGIYIASKTKHADRWRFLRDKVGEPIISTWIDEAGEGETADFHDLWGRCLKEAASCRVLIAYREKDEVLKGGWVEIGAALASGIPVFAVGLEDFTIAKYRGITHFSEMKAAIAASRSLHRGEAQRTDGGERFIDSAYQIAEEMRQEAKLGPHIITKGGDGVSYLGKPPHARNQYVDFDTAPQTDGGEWKVAPDILLDQIAAIRDEYHKLRRDCLDQMEWHASQGNSEEAGDFSTEAERHGAALLACNRILKLVHEFKPARKEP